MLSTTLRLTKAQRLKKPADYQRVYNSKQWGNSRLFSFNVLACGSHGSPAVLGVTVSKKVSKLAVSRNRIKRQIKEYYRHHQFELSDASLVITAKPLCNKASDQERLESLDELWGKVLGWKRWTIRQKAKALES